MTYQRTTILMHNLLYYHHWGVGELLTQSHFFTSGLLMESWSAIILSSSACCLARLRRSAGVGPRGRCSCCCCCCSNAATLAYADACCDAFILSISVCSEMASTSGSSCKNCLIANCCTFTG